MTTPGHDDPNDSSVIAYERPDVERPASAPVPPTLDYNRAKPHDPYLALRYAAFRYFQLGFMSATIGDQITEVAVGWYLFLRTHNPLALGWVGLVTAAPVILLALPAGHFADLHDRRAIVICMNVLRALCIALLAWLVHRNGAIGAMYLTLAVIATCKAISGPARSALLPALVPVEVFASAVTWNSSAFQVSAMVGPAIGGLLVRWTVPGACLLAAGGTLLFPLLLLFVRTTGEPTSRKEPPSLKAFIAGVQFVAQTKIILATITLDLFAVLLGGAVYLLPVYASDILRIGAVGFGWLRAAPAIGALAMGLLVAHLPPMRRAGRAMLLAVAGFGVATIVFGISRNFWLSLVMLFLTGAFDNISVLVRHTLVQVLTPDAMRGRVSAVNNIFIGASNELGGFESGLTARLMGPITSVVVGGIGTIVVVILTAITWPQVAKFGSLVDARPEEEAGGVPAS